MYLKLFCGLFIRNSGIVAVLIAESSLIVAATINISRMAISPIIVSGNYKRPPAIVAATNSERLR